MKYNNPLTLNQADPWVYHHSDGFYYYTATYHAFDRLIIRKASSLEELQSAREYTLGTADTGWMKNLYPHVWAPEIHFIEGSWYLFFTAGVEKNNVWSVRSHVAKCSGSDPLTDEWKLLGKIHATVPGGSEDIMTCFNLDGTVFEADGQWYYTWAQYVYKDGSFDEVKGGSSFTLHGKSYVNGADNNGWSCIFIGKTNPADFTKVTDAAIIAVPEFGWEYGTETYEFRGGHYEHNSGNVNVNEGPAILKRNGKVFIAYSASACDEAYCLGLLTADENSDLTEMTSWKKSPVPVFMTSMANSVYGPGHCSFTTDKDGKDLIVYHARNYYGLYTGGAVYSTTKDGLSDPHRSARVKQIDWKSDGTPDFGEAE